MREGGCDAQVRVVGAGGGSAFAQPEVIALWRSSGPLAPREALLYRNRGKLLAIDLGNQHRGLPLSSPRGPRLKRVGRGSPRRRPARGRPLCAVVPQ